MILHTPPGSSALVRDAAEAILVLHIAGGVGGVLSGAVALVVRKGSPAHAWAGTVFLACMLIMSLIGAVVAPFLPRPQLTSTFAGAFTFYLVITGWATARRRTLGVGPLEIAGFAMALCVFAAGLALIGLASATPGGSIDGVPRAAPYIFSIAAGIAACGDLSVILRGGVSGRQRTIRHLWRMCVALLVAAVSFFLGQPQVFPVGLRGSPVLFAPELFVLGAMVFWLLRVGLAGRRRASAPHPTQRAAAMDEALAPSRKAPT